VSFELTLSMVVSLELTVSLTTTDGTSLMLTESWHGFDGLLKENMIEGEELDALETGEGADFMLEMGWAGWKLKEGRAEGT